MSDTGTEPEGEWPEAEGNDPTRTHLAQEEAQRDHSQETLPEDPDPEAPIDSEPPPETTEPPVDPGLPEE